MKPKTDMVENMRRMSDDVDIEMLPSKSLDTVVHDCPARGHSDVLGLLSGETCPFCNKQV